MPIIEPIPMDELSPRAREIIQGGVEQGLYSTPLPLQVFAYRSGMLEMMHAKRLDSGKGSLLGGRILELLRIRSAQLGECQPCMQSRKHDSISDADVACLVGDSRQDLDAQERLAIRFLDLLSADHHALDADFYRELGEVFTSAQIVELGFACAEMMGVHRFIHTLDVFGTDPPALPYRPDQVDTARSADESSPVTA